MKNRSWIYAIAALVAVLALVFCKRPAQPPSGSERSRVPAQSSDGSTHSANVASRTAPNARPTLVPPPAILTEADDEHRRWEEWQRAAEEANVPIDFHGVVIDQDSNPLSGVVVKVVVRHWAVAEPGAPPPDLAQFRLERVTGADGRFEIDGVTGDGFDLESITKQGYEAHLRRRGFGSTEGSFTDPVMFKMWRLGQKAHLVGGSKFWGIVPDGRVYTIDLLLGTKVESGDAPGDLRVSVARPTGVSRRDRYDWSFQITPVDGGIIETHDEFMYKAPESGYASEYELRLSASDPHWTDEQKKAFYVKTRRGQDYGRVSLEVFAHYQDAAVLSIDYAVNPDGSTNLQP